MISAPEPPFEALEVSTTPLSIASPAQPPPTTAERKEYKPAQEPAKTKVQLCDYYEAAFAFSEVEMENGDEFFNFYLITRN